MKLFGFLWDMVVRTQRAAVWSTRCNGASVTDGRLAITALYENTVATTSWPSCWRIERKRGTWKKQTCAVRDTCSRNDSWVTRPSRTPRSRTMTADSMTLHAASSHGAAARKDFLQISLNPNTSNSVLLAFNCRRFDAHYPVTSTKESSSFDIIWGMSAGGQCNSPWVSSANRW